MPRRGLEYDGAWAMSLRLDVGGAISAPVVHLVSTRFIIRMGGIDKEGDFRIMC